MQLVEKKDVKTIVSELEEGIIELMNPLPTLITILIILRKNYQDFIFRIQTEILTMQKSLARRINYVRGIYL